MFSHSCSQGECGSGLRHRNVTCHQPEGQQVDFDLCLKFRSSLYHSNMNISQRGHELLQVSTAAILSSLLQLHSNNDTTTDFHPLQQLHTNSDTTILQTATPPPHSSFILELTLLQTITPLWHPNTPVISKTEDS